MTDKIREYINEEAGIVVVGDEVYIRTGDNNYISKYTILEEYANMYKVRDIEHPSALMLYVTKDTFDLVNGDGGIRKKDKGDKRMFWKRRKKDRDGSVSLTEPIRTSTVASDNLLTQPAGSNTGNVIDSRGSQKAGDNYVSGGGYGSLYRGKYGGTYHSAWDKYDCHTGNSIVGTRTTRNGGYSLMIAGWGRGAHEEAGMAVIDLTGYGKQNSPAAFYYDFKVKDYGVPYWSDFFWRQLAELTYHHLEYGDVLIICQGGHGRSGMVTAIVAGLIRDKQDFHLIDDKDFFTNPIKWIRTVHCAHAIETYAQERLVVNVLLQFYPTSKRLKLMKQNMRAPKVDRYKNSKKKNYSPVPTKESVDSSIEAWKKEDDDWLDKWVDEEFDRKSKEQEPICPICLTKADNIDGAVMCCNSKNHNQFCPMCGTWHRTPIEALACCQKYNTGFTKYERKIGGTHV